jgi:polysaccharide deacetylase family protein (PEP-CTERM system associated)
MRMGVSERGFVRLPPVTFTVDVENPGDRDGAEPRYPAMTRALLGFLAQHAILGTFFVEDGVAQRSPGLVREIARAGHEIGSHSFRHLDLVHEDAAAFAVGIAAAKARLEDLTGAPVLGFRAPRFSLTRRSRWAVEVLGDAGFAYSSSVLPGWGIPYGYRGAPCRPFLWPNGLLEIPCPVGRIGPLSVAFLGGMNLRYLPPWRYRWMTAAVGEQTCWTYCHPYDIDLDEPFRVIREVGLLCSVLLWCNRRTLLRRWGGLAGNAAPRFADRLDELRRHAQVFVEPAARASPVSRLLAAR